MEMAEIFRLFGSVGVEGVDEAEKKADSLVKKWEKAGEKMSKAGKKLTLAVTTPIVGMMTGFAKAAMDLEATEAKYNTVFDGMTDVADDFIKKFKELTPATTAEARNMASGIQDLLIPMGFAREEATAMTGEMFHLIGALTNFNSGTHTAQDVASAFSSALTGSTEPLKRLGIQVNQETIRQKALEMGLIGVKDELDNQSKAQALLQLAYEQSGDALAGYTEASLDTKTKMGLMKAEVIDIAAKFGEHLLPILNDVITWLGKGVEWFGSLTEEQRKTTLTIMAIVAAIGPLLLIIGKTIAVVTTAVKWFGLISAAVAKAGGVMAVVTGPIGWVVAAIVALIAIGVLLWKNWDTIKEKALQLYDGIKETFANIGRAIMAPIEKAKNFVYDMIEKIKSFFNFKWSLPELKMPKISIDGKFSLLPPSVPKFSIKWNKDGFLMDQANIFGSLGNTLLGGGEAGPEALLPLNRDVLGNIGAGIADASDLNKPGLLDRLDAIIDLLLELINIDPKYQVLLDSGALVGELTPLIDQRMGRRAERKMRGG